MKDRWTTTVALVAAAARTVRGHRRLLAFPVLAVAAMVVAAVLMFKSQLGVVSLVSRAGGFEDSRPIISLMLGIGLALWYLGHVALTFWAVALSRAALDGLRGQPVSIPRATWLAFKQFPAIMGFALLSATLGAVLSAIERRSRLVVRAFVAMFGLSWTMVSLFAITAMAGERRGALASLRRGSVLLQSSWADGRLSTLGLGLLWVPVVAIEAGAVWWAEAGGPLAAVPLGEMIVALNTLLWAGAWLLERVYAAAVYCYAVEGVVPGPFDDQRLHEVWRLVASPAAAAAPAQAGTHRPRRVERRPLAIAAATVALLGGLSYLGWDLGRGELYQMYFPRAGLAVDQTNFGEGPRLRTTRPLTIPLRFSAVAAALTREGPAIFAISRRRFLRLDHTLRVVAAKQLPAIAGSLTQVEVLELSPGVGVLVGTNSLGVNRRSDAVVALDWDGRVLFQRTAPEGETIQAFASVLTRSGWGVAVGYGGYHGLCLIDESGGESWCNQRVGSVGVVAAMDCDGDGRQDILSGSPEDQANHRQLGCYSTDGRQIANLPIPIHISGRLRAVDLDGDGRQEIAYLNAIRNRRFGALQANGGTLMDVEVADVPDRFFPQDIVAARRHRGGPRDVVVIGPSGELLGVSRTGERWTAGTYLEDVAALDVDGDGSDELITLERATYEGAADGAPQTLSLWSWNGRADQPPERASDLVGWERDELMTAPRSRVESQQPLRPYAHPPSRGCGSSEELWFLHGCYLALGIQREILPAIVERNEMKSDIPICEAALARLDASTLLVQSNDSTADLEEMTSRGCHQGVEALDARYRLGQSPAQQAGLTNWCVFLASGRQRPGVTVAQPRSEANDLPAVRLPMEQLSRRQLSQATTAPRPRPVDDLAYDPDKMLFLKVCVSASGRVTAVTPVYEHDDGNDFLAAWITELRTWRYRPFLVGDTAIPFCSTTLLNGQPPPPGPGGPGRTRAAVRTRTRS